MKGFIVTAKRISAMFLAALLMFSSVDYGVLSAAAAERTETTCPNHPEHTADCGYVEAVEGADCTHEHTDECYRIVTECVHEHGEECYEKELTCENTEEGHEHTDECYTKTLNCTHECSEESGCIRRELDCKHEHDESCGYREAVEGHPCTHSCELCSGAAEESTEDGTTDVEDERTCICEDKCTGDMVNEDCPVCSAEGADLEKDCKGGKVQTELPEKLKALQERMNALPTVAEYKSMTGELVEGTNVTEVQYNVYMEACDLYDEYDALPDKEKAQLDISKLEALLNYCNETFTECSTKNSTTPEKGIDYDVAYSEIRNGKTPDDGGGSMRLPVGTRIYFDEDNIMEGSDDFQFFADTYETAVSCGYIAGVTEDDLSDEQKAYMHYYYVDSHVKGSIITLQPYYLYNDFKITCGGQWMVTACGEDVDVLQIYSLTPTSTTYYAAELENTLTTVTAKLSQTKYIIPDAEVFLTVMPKSGTLSAGDVKIELTNCSLKSDTPTVSDDGSLVYTLHNFTNDATVTVKETDAGSVTGVTVSPDIAAIKQGETQQFTATVSGTGNFDNTVTWTVEGAVSTNTKIDENGKLTIGADETASSITVKAIANGDHTKSASVMVTVINKDL